MGSARQLGIATYCRLYGWLGWEWEWELACGCVVARRLAGRGIRRHAYPLWLKWTNAKALGLSQTVALQKPMLCLTTAEKDKAKGSKAATNRNAPKASTISKADPIPNADLDPKGKNPSKPNVVNDVVNLL